MLTISNTTLHLVRTLAKQLCGLRKRRTGLTLTVHPHGRDIGLEVRWQGFGLRYEVRTPESQPAANIEPFVIAFDDLADVLQAKHCDVDFVIHGDSLGVYWNDRGVERLVRVPYQQPAPTESVPGTPAEWTNAGPLFADAYLVAAATTSTDSARYAMTHIQCDGHRGRLAATDGVQAMIHNGFDLPWDDTPLVPATAPLGHRVLDGRPIRLARVTVDSTVSGSNTPASDHVLMNCGPWTFWLPVTGGRFPDMDRIVPQQEPVSRLALDRNDCVYLANALDAFPGTDAIPVTVELGNRVIVACESGGETVSIDLPASRTLGEHGVFTTRRKFLKRATELQFDEIAFHGEHKPAVCQSDERSYIWMTLANPQTASQSSSKPQSNAAVPATA